MSARPAPAPLLAVAAAAFALAPGTAMAHSAVIGSDPAEGARLTSAPTTLTIHFNENIRHEFSYAKLTAGGAQTAVTTSVSGHDLVVHPSEPLANGSYTLAYRIASEDTHPVSGAIHFTVAAAAAATSPTAVPTTTSSASASSPTSASSAVATPSPSPSTASSGSAETSSSGSSTGFWLGVFGLAVVAAVAGWWAGTRYRRSR